MRKLYDLTPTHIEQYTDLYVIENDFLYSLLMQCNGNIAKCINLVKKESKSVPKQHMDIFIQRITNCLEVIYNLHVDKVKTESKIIGYTCSQMNMSRLEICN